MAGAVQEVERAVTEVVECVEGADPEGLGTVVVEGDFSHGPSIGDISVEVDGRRIRGIPRPMGIADPRADDESRGHREGRRVPDVVEVGVRPDDGLDVGAVDAQGGLCVQDVGDVARVLDRRLRFDHTDDMGR